MKYLYVVVLSITIKISPTSIAKEQLFHCMLYGFSISKQHLVTNCIFLVIYMIYVQLKLIFSKLICDFGIENNVFAQAMKY